jgi:transcription initiation factor TFIID subunit 9B
MMLSSLYKLVWVGSSVVVYPRRWADHTVPFIHLASSNTSLQYILSLASQTNATPLPSVPEVFGVRLPPASETLTAVNFDLVPNKPPPEAKLYDEEIEEIEEEEDDEELPDGQDDDDDADMEPAAIPYTSVAPITPTDVDIGAGTPLPIMAADTLEENSDAEEADGLFGGEGDDDDDNSGDDAMEEVQTAGDTQTNGVKRKLVEEDDYD